MRLPSLMGIVPDCPGSSFIVRTLYRPLTHSTTQPEVSVSLVSTVLFSSSDVQAGLPGFYTFTAADAGVHTFSIALRTAGSQSVTIRDFTNVALTATQTGITVTAGCTSNPCVRAGDAAAFELWCAGSGGKEVDRCPQKIGEVSGGPFSHGLRRVVNALDPNGAKARCDPRASIGHGARSERSDLARTRGDRPRRYAERRA